MSTTIMNYLRSSFESTERVELPEEALHSGWSFIPRAVLLGGADELSGISRQVHEDFVRHFHVLWDEAAGEPELMIIGDRVRRRLNLHLLGAAVLGCLLLIEPVYSSVPITLLGRAALWLGNQIISYGFGKAVDKLTGADYEAQLSELKRELEVQLARSTSVERRKIEEQLALTQSQLNTLKELLHSAPTPEQLPSLQARVREEVPQIRAVLANLEGLKTNESIV